MRTRLPIFVFLLSLLVACGPAGGQTTTATPEIEDTPAIETPALEVEETAQPPEGPPAEFEGVDYTTTDSGLQIAVIEEGGGEQAEAGDVVRVHYTGMLGDGTVFDSSSNRGEPFVFPLGQGQVIPGWDEGIAQLREGSVAKLIIPPELGYGSGGSGPIPPNSTLYFDVELVEVLAGGPQEPTDIDEDEFVETDSGLQYAVITEGSGEMPEEGQPISMHYTAWLEDGTRIDSSRDFGRPITFPVGSDQVFEGWNEAVAAMQVGDEWQVIIPPELALGEEGGGEVIPPDSTLIIEMELLEILPSGPDEPTSVEESDYTETESGLKYYDLEEGSGNEVQPGDNVTVHYTGWLEDGTRFDSSYQRGETYDLVVGFGQAIPGWDEGLVGMKEGGRRQLVIPPDLAYGEQGAGGVIPPDATLTFEIELQEITASQN